MDKEKAKKIYINKFGGFPEFLLMGASDKEVIEAIKEALKSGKEIEALTDRDY